MAFRYVARVTVRDARGETANIVWDFGELTAFATADLRYLEATLRLNDLLAELANVCIGEVVYKSINTFENVLAGTAPAGSRSNECVVATCFLTEDGKVANVRIPAPAAGLFLPGTTEVDTSATSLINYIAALETRVFVSDGEVIDTTVGNGIKKAVWLSKARRGD